MAQTRELIEEPLSSEELAARYRDMCADPYYAKVPGKIELDVWGRLLMTPPNVYHGTVQGRLCQKLAALGGETSVETPIATATALFVTDVAWSSSEFARRHAGETPLMSAPEICIEVVSPSNSIKELREKVSAYLAAGAAEAWIVYPQSKRCEFYGKAGQLQRSAYAVELSSLFE
jgi:Uma2 family endonuclease